MAPPGAAAGGGPEGLAIWDPMAPGRFRRGICVADRFSPGIPHLYLRRPIGRSRRPGLRACRSTMTVGLFFRSLGLQGWDEMEEPPKVVAVTGSNGKSTTLGAESPPISLTVAGKSVQLAGNIGPRGCSTSDPPEEGGVVGAGTSAPTRSNLARALTPGGVAVFYTIFSPDHLDRHGGMGVISGPTRRGSSPWAGPTGR